VVVLGGGAVMAQTPAAGNGSTFLDRVAQKLGIDTPKLQQAITDTRNEDIDAAVANGDLTQKQADALKERIQNAPVGGFGEHSFGGPKGFRQFDGFKGGPGFGFGMGLADIPQQFADFLGITTDVLMTELRADDATLATVAEAHGKSRDELKSYITTTAKTKLDEVVTNGNLTQKHEDEMLAMLSDNLDKIIDGKFAMFFRGGMGHHRGMPGGAMPWNDDVAPNVPAPQSGSGGEGTRSF
jgi:uncharacterized protein YidB (DUF937 family)